MHALEVGDCLLVPANLHSADGNEAVLFALRRKSRAVFSFAVVAAGASLQVTYSTPCASLRSMLHYHGTCRSRHRSFHCNVDSLILLCRSTMQLMCMREQLNSATTPRSRLSLFRKNDLPTPPSGFSFFEHRWLSANVGGGLSMNRSPYPSTGPGLRTLADGGWANQYTAAKLLLWLAKCPPAGAEGNKYFQCGYRWREVRVRSPVAIPELQVDQYSCSLPLPFLVPSPQKNLPSMGRPVLANVDPVKADFAPLPAGGEAAAPSHIVSEAMRHVLRSSGFTKPLASQVVMMARWTLLRLAGADLR